MTKYINAIKTYFLEYGLKEFIWLVLYSCILLPQSLIGAVHPGLDASWQLSINLAIQKQLTFGTDYIFTFGPLGFLHTKYAIAASKWGVLAFEIFIISCSIFILRQFLKKSDYHILSYIAIPSVLILLTAQDYSLIHLLPPVFLFFIFYFFIKKNILALAVAAFISVIGLYIKINFGLILISTLYIALAVGTIKKTLSFSQSILFICGQMLFVYLFTLLFNIDLKFYLLSSLHLIDAYNDAMYAYISVSNWYFIAGLTVVLLYFAGFMLYYRYYFKNIFVLCSYCLGGLFIYLFFKNANVRADLGHEYEFFKTVGTLFSLMYFVTNDGLKKTWATFTGIVISLSYIILINANIITMDCFTRIVSFNYFSDIFNDVSYKNIMQREEIFNDTIPSSYVTIIGNKSVDIMPFYISEIYYHHLNYNPRPVVQSYSAYDEYLDTKNYEKYISASAPDYVIYSNSTIDLRNPFWDESITKRALLTHYEVINMDSTDSNPFEFNEEAYLTKYPDVRKAVKEGAFKSGYKHYFTSGRREGRDFSNNYLLFKKRKNPLHIKLIKEHPLKITINKEYKINNSDHLQYLYATVRYNLGGKLKRLLFQPPVLEVILKYEDSTTIRYKAITTILKTGVLLNKRIDNTSSAGLFFYKSGNACDKVVSIQFVAPYGFEPIIEATIKEVQIEK